MHVRATSKEPRERDGKFGNIQSPSATTYHLPPTTYHLIRVDKASHRSNARRDRSLGSWARTSPLPSRRCRCQARANRLNRSCHSSVRDIPEKFPATALKKERLHHIQSLEPRSQCAC